MGQKFSRFMGGVGRFAMGALKAVPNAIQGGLSGFSMGGPKGAALGALTGMIPGIQQGLQNAVGNAHDPRGPQTLQEGIHNLGRGALNLTRSALQSQMFRNGVQDGVGVMGRFATNVMQGQSMRSAFESAGGSNYLNAQLDNFSNAAGNKLAGWSGVNPERAMALGNPILRTALARSGAGSIHRYGVLRNIQSHGLALASQGLGTFLGYNSPGMMYAKGGGGAMPGLASGDQINNSSMQGRLMAPDSVNNSSVEPMNKMRRIPAGGTPVAYSAGGQHAYAR